MRPREFEVVGQGEDHTTEGQLDFKKSELAWINEATNDPRMSTAAHVRAVEKSASRPEVELAGATGAIIVSWRSKRLQELSGDVEERAA